MTGSGADHWFGINWRCDECGAKGGGTIPKGHYLGCSKGPQPVTPERQAELNAESARVREANRLQSERFPCDRAYGPNHDHDRLACGIRLEEERQARMRENVRA